MTVRPWMLLLFLLVFIMQSQSSTARQPSEKPGLTISWADNFLTIGGEHLAGGEIRINYLEAYCRPGSTDRDWGKTVIPHRAELIPSTDHM